MAPIPSTRTIPPPKTIKGSWLASIIGILVVLLIWSPWSKKTQIEASAKPGPPTPTISPLINLSPCTDDDGAVAPKNFVAVGLNNPYGIKFSQNVPAIIEEGGTKSEAARDGGNFAMFPTPEAGTESARRLLRGSRRTVDEEMRRWSNFNEEKKRGYDAKIVSGVIEPTAITGDLPPTLFDTLMRAMFRKETGAEGETTRTSVVDMSRFTGNEFTITVTHCFTKLIMPESPSWLNWKYDPPTEKGRPDPNAWYSAWPEGVATPWGPFGKKTPPPPPFNDMPKFSLEASKGEGIVFKFSKR